MFFSLSDARLERRLLLASGPSRQRRCPWRFSPMPRRTAGDRCTSSTAVWPTSLHSWAVSAPHGVGFLEGVSTVLGPWPLRAVALGVAVVLAVRGQRRLALWAGTTVAVAGALGFFLKLIVARSRPSLPDPVAVAGGSSFPSGHALNSFVILGVFALLAVPTVPRALAPLRVGNGRRGRGVGRVRACRPGRALRQ